MLHLHTLTKPINNKLILIGFVKMGISIFVIAEKSKQGYPSSLILFGKLCQINIPIAR